MGLRYAVRHWLALAQAWCRLEAQIGDTPGLWTGYLWRGARPCIGYWIYSLDLLVGDGGRPRGIDAPRLHSGCRTATGTGFARRHIPPFLHLLDAHARSRWGREELGSSANLFCPQDLGLTVR